MTHTIETRYLKPNGSWASKDKRELTLEESIADDRFWAEVHSRHYARRSKDDCSSMVIE